MIPMDNGRQLFPGEFAFYCLAQDIPGCATGNGAEWSGRLRF